MKDLVSVVVPIYNVEKYLVSCVDSLIGQTYSNLEIILVDDESPDRSPAVCDEYAAKDPRVKVLHKENGGLSDARNAGLEIARGEWIAFVDGDDIVHRKFIEILVSAAEKTDAEIAACFFEKFYDEDEATIDEAIDLSHRDQYEVFTSREAVKDLLTPKTKMWVMTWNKLYKKSLFTDNEIEFPKGKIHEDNFTTYKLYHCANEVTFVNIPLYLYRQRKDSIMGRKFDNRRLDIIEAVIQLKDFFANKKTLEIEDEIKYYSVFISLGILDAMLQAEGNFEKEINDIRKSIIIDYDSMNNTRDVSAHHKVAVLLLKSNMFLYKTMSSIKKGLKSA